MRSSLLVTSLVGGAVSLLAVASTRSAPPAPQVPLATVVENAAAIAVPVQETDRVPSWVLERTVDGPPVSLTASDGSGLVLAELRSSAVVVGPLAFTEMRLVFENPEARVREGTFKVVLPQGASIGRFAMKIDGAWQEGEVVPRDKARVAYEDALHRKQDPALLERGAGNEFTARVFPIPARGRKEIVVSYGQELVGGAPYALPLRGLPEVKALDISVGGEGMKTQREHHEHYTPTADFVFEGKGGPSPRALRSGNLVVARVKPVAEALAERVASAVVLVDTSASRGLGLGAELAQVKAILGGIA
ncbi:MAG TPA: VIT domain-containing protein, partial [Polyangiaceae bacterium]